MVMASPRPSLAGHYLPSLKDQELVLTPVEIERLCAHALKGEFEPVDRWIQLCRGTFGMDHVEEGSLFPADHSSPFVVAAHACQVKFLRHLLKRYPDAIPINRTAKISLPFILDKERKPLRWVTTCNWPYRCTHEYEYQPPQEAKKEHYCSAVLAACAASSYKARRLDVVKLLVRAGASVNTPECCGVTPLHAVLMYGCNPKLVKFLLNQGADTNATDCLGRTPLMLAALAQNHACSVATRLIKTGAKMDAVDKAGQSVLHYAASVGSSEMVRLLLASGVDPMFKPAHAPIHDQTESYVPCPLYLAAAKGHGKLVRKLLDHPGCPHICKVEALLLMGASRLSGLSAGECELSRRSFSVHVEDLWSRALSVLEEHSITMDYPAPIADYGNRKEIQNVSELRTMSSEHFTVNEAYYQCLMILERCLGYADSTLMESLHYIRDWFFILRNFRDAENLLLREAEMVLHIGAKSSYGNRVVFYNPLMTLLLSRTYWNVSRLQRMLEHECLSDYPRYLRLILGIMEVHGTKCGFVVHDEWSVFFQTMAFLFNSWLLGSECTDENGFHIGCDECEEIGKKLVKLFFKHGSIIGFLLCETHAWRKDGHKLVFAETQCSNYLPVVAAFLRWGAARQINDPLQCCGQRQLHMAVLQASDYSHHKPMVSLLLQFGAHYDAVNAAGQTAREICTSVEEEEALFPPPFPLPLMCYASRSIVKHHIPYKDMDLPSHVKQVIALHDPSAFKPIPGFKPIPSLANVNEITVNVYS